MSKFNRYRVDHPLAYKNLSKQLVQGNLLKTIAIRLLIEISALKFLFKAPVIGSLLKTSEGLLLGHIANAQMLERCPQSPAQNRHTQDMIPNFIEVDVLVIGSGPGAAVATEIEMSSADRTICVIERGDVPRTPNELHHSLTHVINDFYQGGQELVVAPGLPLYAQGSVMGGGSEVNSGLFHNLPELYRDDWASAFGITAEEWLRTELITSHQLGPEVMNVKLSNSLLARGAENSNLICENIPRWRSYDDQGGYSHRGMNLLFWNKDEVRSRISFFTNSEAESIDSSNKNFVSVKVRNTITGAVTDIRAQRVHVAGGAIATPVILAKSKLIRWSDTEFAWHPMIRVVARTKKDDLGAGDIDPFQAWTVDRNLKFGSAVSTAPLLSVALGRLVSIEEAAELRSFYVSFSSSGKGGILPLLNLPWYRFSAKDRALAAQGVEILKEVITLGGGELINPADITSKKFSTVHIFGTLPINCGIFTPGTNKLKTDNRIRVSDASILPFGPGVNPQGVVMSSVRIANRELMN